MPSYSGHAQIKRKRPEAGELSICTVHKLSCLTDECFHLQWLLFIHIYSFAGFSEPESIKIIAKLVLQWKLFWILNKLGCSRSLRLSFLHNPLNSKPHWPSSHYRRTNVASHVAVVLMLCGKLLIVFKSFYTWERKALFVFFLRCNPLPPFIPVAQVQPWTAVRASLHLPPSTTSHLCPPTRPWHQTLTAAWRLLQGPWGVVGD